MIFAGALLLQLTGTQECATAVNAGKQAFESHHYQIAASEFERASTLCTDRATVLVSLGQVLYLIGKEAEAESTLTEAAKLRPKDATIHYHLSRMFYQQNRFPQALEEGLKAIELEPKDFRAHDSVALIYASLRRDEDAIRHFLRALDLVHKDHPTHDWSYSNFANFLIERNEYEKAFQLAAEAANRNPNAARNFFLTGKALVKLEKADLAIRWLEQAVKLDPDHSEATYLLAQVYRKAGRKDDADRALDRFREISKKSNARR